MWAMPMPVLPAVPSTTVPPGFSAPLCSAARIIHSAARSLTEPPGFRNSALPRISQPVSAESLPSLISGVLPTVSMKPLRVVIPYRSSKERRVYRVGGVGQRPRRNIDIALASRAVGLRCAGSGQRGRRLAAVELLETLDHRTTHFERDVAPHTAQARADEHAPVVARCRIEARLDGRPQVSDQRIFEFHRV